MNICTAYICNVFVIWECTHMYMLQSIQVYMAIYYTYMHIICAQRTNTHAHARQPRAQSPPRERPPHTARSRVASCRVRRVQNPLTLPNVKIDFCARLSARSVRSAFICQRFAHNICVSRGGLLLRVQRVYTTKCMCIYACSLMCE